MESSFFIHEQSEKPSHRQPEAPEERESRIILLNFFWCSPKKIVLKDFFFGRCWKRSFMYPTLRGERKIFLRFCGAFYEFFSVKIENDERDARNSSRKSGRRLLFQLFRRWFVGLRNDATTDCTHEKKESSDALIESTPESQSACKYFRAENFFSTRHPEKKTHPKSKVDAFYIVF